MARHIPSEDNLQYLFEYVKDGSVVHFDSFSSIDQEDLICSKTPDGTYCNLLMFAIEEEHYDLTDRILQVLRDADNTLSSSVIQETNDDDNNCLQVLISKMIRAPFQRFGVSTKSVASIEIPKMIEVLKLLLSFTEDVYKLITNRNKHKETALIQTTTSKSEKIASLTNDLLQSLSCDKRIGILKQLEECCCFEKHSKPREECREQHNLLMLALKDGTRSATNAIVDFVRRCQVSQDDKCEIVLRSSMPKGWVQFPGCLCLAAKYDQWHTLESLMNWLPEKQRFYALLQEERSGNCMSAIKFLLQKNSISELKNLLNNMPTPEFHESDMKQLFLHLEMSVAAIDAFNEKDFCKDQFLIPRPSQVKLLSRPSAMIFYKNAKNLLGLTEARAMETAFRDLGWTDVTLNKDNWKYKELLQQLEKKINDDCELCSLFILCVTSHGSRPIDGHMDDASGDIGEICTRIEKLPAFIPKVIIIDACRNEEGWQFLKAKFAMHNAALLRGMRYDKEASEQLYLKYLAKEISKGDATIQDMHIRAIANAKNQQKNDKKKKEGSAHAKIQKDDDCARNTTNGRAGAERRENAENEGDGFSQIEEVAEDSEDDNKAEMNEELTSNADSKSKTPNPTFEATGRRIRLGNYYSKLEEKCCRKKIMGNYCQKPIGNMDKCIPCDNCFCFFHLDCVGLKGEKKTLERPDVQWFCPDCMDKRTRL